MHGTALRGFAVSHRDVFIRHKAGDVILADSEQRAFFEQNGVPVAWSDS